MLPPTPHNLILFQLDFDVKFPLLFLIDLKSTIFNKKNTYNFNRAEGYFLFEKQTFN